MLKILMPQWLYILILINAHANDLPPELVMGVVWAESTFRPAAVGNAGNSYGLMQLHIHGAGSGHNPNDLLDPAYNLRVGSRYLRECLDAAEGSIPDAVSAYNQGIGGWRARGRVINQVYVNRVLDYQRKLRSATIELTSYPLDLCKVYIQEV